MRTVVRQMLNTTIQDAAKREALLAVYDVVSAPVEAFGAETDVAVATGQSALMLYNLTVVLPRNKEWQAVAASVIPMLSQYAVQLREVSLFVGKNPNEPLAAIMIGRLYDQSINVFMACFELIAGRGQYSEVLKSIITIRGGT